MKANKIKIALVQTAVGLDINANLDKTLKFIREAAKKGAKIVCLQELFATRYFAQTEDKKFFELAETIPGKITDFLSRAAKDNKIILVGGSLYEKGDEKYYNTTLIFNENGSMIAKYRKMHIPHDPNYYEQYYFSPGDLGYVQVNAGTIKGNDSVVISPLICYDQWFPEAARINALNGSQIIFYPTAIGWFKELKENEPFSAKRWENAMRAHASLNGIFVAAVNRVGKEDNIAFWGGSFIADPFGEIVARASSIKEEVLVAEIDLSQIKASQEGWGFFRNRRPEYYADLTRDIAALKASSKETLNTPKSLGYRMPAEWEKQEAVWLSWPHNLDTWPGRLEEAENSYLQFVKALHTGQKINILVNDNASELTVKNKLKKAQIDLSKIIFYQITTVDAWIRDYGPTFVVNKKTKQLAMVKWNFNAWGNKYSDLKEDKKIPYDLNKRLSLQMFEPGIVLEGGSIEINGAGTVLVTEQCLLNKNRNPRLSKEAIEKYLKEFLNVRNVLWLKEGIVGDDTDGHIDDVARFINKNTILCAYEDNKSDANHLLLKENYELLKSMKDQDGKSFNIIKLPMPGYIGDKKTRLPASYANFYIGNNAVVVPVFGHENDAKALKIIQKLFPGRKVVGINCMAMVYGLGTLHCCSQQQPEV